MVISQQGLFPCFPAAGQDSPCVSSQRQVKGQYVLLPPCLHATFPTPQVSVSGLFPILLSSWTAEPGVGGYTRLSSLGPELGGWLVGNTSPTL